MQQSRTADGSLQRLVRPVNLAWLAVYLLMLGGVWWGMQRAHAWAVENYGTPAAQQEWSRWVEDVRQSGETPSPVERRVPKSAVPPAYALMTEHYASCLFGALLLSSALFLSLMVLIRGAFHRPPTRPRKPTGSLKN